MARTDALCASLAAAVPAAPDLAEECLHGYVMMLSAHFQGFCRDLYTECGDAVLGWTTPALRVYWSAQAMYGVRLNTGNPNRGNIGADFNRFAFPPAMAFWSEVDARVGAGHPAALADLNDWRNAIAHHDLPAGLPLPLSRVQGWRAVCDDLAGAFDAVMYDRLTNLLSAPPWVP